MSNRPDVLALVAFTALAGLAGACTSKESVAQRARPDKPNDAPQESAAPVPAERVDTVLKGTKAREPERRVDTRRRTGDPPERPWADNTGPTDPGVLTPSGSQNITADGTVLVDVDITGMVVIDADNVILRNFRIHDSSSYGIRIANGHRGILIEDGEIFDVSTGILGVGFTGRRLYIHDVQNDGTKAQGAGGETVVEYSFFEKLGIKDGAHADGNQTINGANITFRYNNIWVPAKGPNYPGQPYDSNSAFMNSGDISNFVIEYNWLNGGNYTIYCGKDGSRGVSVRYNRFGPDYRYGIITGKCDQNMGNVWEGSGDPI